MLLFVCPSYCYICVSHTVYASLILLCVCPMGILFRKDCPHTATYVSLILSHTAIYASLILRHMCPRTHTETDLLDSLFSATASASLRPPAPTGIFFPPFSLFAEACWHSRIASEVCRMLVFLIFLFLNFLNSAEAHEQEAAIAAALLRLYYGSMKAILRLY
jgi:hypothetical protein